MIARPLDLASKLRPEPRNFDFLFLVNAGLIVLFFSLFGSRFVLAPGLGVDFQLPEIAGARAGAVQTTHRITVKPGGLIIIGDGPADAERLGNWLKDEVAKMKAEAKKMKTEAKPPRKPSLLVIASNDVSYGQTTEVAKLAIAAGFTVQFAAEESPTGKK